MERVLNPEFPHDDENYTSLSYLLAEFFHNVRLIAHTNILNISDKKTSEKNLKTLPINYFLSKLKNSQKTREMLIRMEEESVEEE